jgi:hypothetical protein
MGRSFFKGLQRLTKSWMGSSDARRAGRRGTHVLQSRGRPLAIESLESRRLLTTTLSFSSNVLSINIGAASEAVKLSVAGANLSVTSNDAGGTTASGAAVTTLGFAAAAGQNVANTGSIAAANDVRQIVVTGSAGTETVDVQGGTFTAMTIGGTLGAVTFDTAPSVFSKISPSAANANLSVTSSAGIAINANVTAGGISVHSGTSGTGNTTFAAGVTVQADTQSFWAGNGAGSAVANLTGNTPTFENTAGTAAPGTFTFRQDATIASAALPAASQFGGTLPGTSYTVESDNGNVTMPATTVAGTLTLTASGAIAETGAIGASLLSTSSSTGTDLSTATNAVASFSAGDASAAPGIALKNTVALAITSISETGGGTVGIVNTGGVSINGAIADAGGTVNLQDTTANILQTAGVITAATLNTKSVTGTTLNGANVVSSFSASDASAAPGIALKNTVALGITSISETGGGTVGIVNAGGISINGAIADAGGTVNLQDTTANILQTAGVITAATLNTKSVTGTTLNDANVVSSFSASDASAAPGIALKNTEALGITSISETGGGTVGIVNTGGISINGAITDAGGTVNLQDTASDIIELAAGVITSNTLDTKSVTSTLLVWGNVVSNFSATNSPVGSIFLGNNSALTITGINQTGGGPVTVSNWKGISITGPITDIGGNVTLKEAALSISQTSAGVITAATLRTSSGSSTILPWANSVSSFNATNLIGSIYFADIATPLTITGISETLSGPVTVNDAGSIVLPAADTITAPGQITLGVGAGLGSTSVIAGTIHSGTSGTPNQIIVNGTGGGNVVNVRLQPAANQQFFSAGLIFDSATGGLANPNVLDITDPATVPTNVYCVEEGTGQIFHGTAQSPAGYDALVSYNANVQKLEIDGNGVDNVTVHVENIVSTSASSPQLPQFFLNAANAASTLKIDASATTMTQQYAIGPIGGIAVGALAPDLNTSSLTWNAGAPNPFSPLPAGATPIPATVPQTFSVNDIALLQYFGGTGASNCTINNTSVNSLMVAAGNHGTLIGGFGSNELLGGPGVSQLIGRGTVDFLLANYTVSYTGVSVGSNGNLVATPTSNGNYIYGYPTVAVYVLTQNNTQIVNTDAAKSFLQSGGGFGLTPSEWLEATFVTSANILKLAQEAPMLVLLPACPNESLFV